MMPASRIRGLALDAGFGLGSCVLRSVLTPVRGLISIPSALFLATLTAMLLRHPDVQFYEIDRIAFGLLALSVLTGALLRREHWIVERASIPMLGLIALALISVSGQAFNNETWSLLASKFVVPFALFHLAALVFRDGSRFRQFEWFVLVVLAYLSFTAIAFLAGAHQLIFPRYILDPNLGFHVTRARGPLLQAVANGVSLNILALLVMHSYRRGSLRHRGVLLVLGTVPIAILATMTRAVWLCFAASAAVAVLLSQSRRLQQRCAWLGVSAMLSIGLLVSCNEIGDRVGNRLEEQGPIEYRQAVYAGGWEMFKERPWLGWGFHQMPAELPRFVGGYRQGTLYPHNTYLELLVENGVVGLGLYFWLMVELWLLGRGTIPSDEEGGFLDRYFHRLWPVILAVYWVNAALVVMSYQFVNGLVFTLAGMLAAQRRRAEAGQLC